MSPVLLDAAEFVAACLHIVFETHMEVIWTGIEGMDDHLLLFMAIASQDNYQMKCLRHVYISDE